MLIVENMYNGPFFRQNDKWWIWIKDLSDNDENYSIVKKFDKIIH